MPLIIGAPKSGKSAQGPMLPGTITGVMPTLCLVDGSTTPIQVMTGHPYYPSVGDKVALVQFGSNYLALPVDFDRSFNAPDDCWHAVGDPGEPGLQNGIVPYTAANDAGYPFGDTLRFFRDRAGVVWLEGLVEIPAVGSTFNGMAIFQLPAGYRPAFQLMFTATTGNGIFKIGVDPSGIVYIHVGAGTATTYMSLDTVNFMAEDGPNPPVWRDLGAFLNTAAGWGPGPGTFVSNLVAATGSVYPGARYCIDACGDIHVSGFVANSSPGQTTTAYLIGLNTDTEWAANVDADFNISTFLVAAAATPGFARADVASSTGGGQIAAPTYGNNTATSGWISLDGLVWPGGNNPTLRWAPSQLINSWTAFSGAFASLQARINRIGTVYLRGLIKGTAATAAGAHPSPVGAAAPNLSKIFSTACGATAGNGAARTDIGVSGVVPGSTLFTAQAAGSATTGYVSMTGIRWSTKPYHG